MLDTLLESAPRSARPVRGFAASAVFHGAVIGAALIVTAQTGMQIREAMAPPNLVYVAPAAQQPMQSQPATTSAQSSRDVVVATPTLPTISIPGISPIDADRTHVFDPNVLFGRDSLPPTAVPGAAGGSIFTRETVDRAVSALPSNGQPAYPAAMRAAGIEGDAAIRFVVDSTGHVEPASVVVLASTHPMFRDAVIHWILRTRYTPAEIAGRRVRQLVEQRVGFTLR